MKNEDVQIINKIIGYCEDIAIKNWYKERVVNYAKSEY